MDPHTDLKYVLDAIRVILDELNGEVPLIGFAGAPWTLFCYMVEGKGSKDWTLARRMLWEEPALSEALLSAITKATEAYLHAQVDAGVHLIQLFDSWAGSLSRELYVERVLPHMQSLCESLKGRVPVTVFAKGGSHFLKTCQPFPAPRSGWIGKPTAAGHVRWPPLRLVAPRCCKEIWTQVCSMPILASFVRRPTK